jgi:hypothetical protein
MHELPDRLVDPVLWFIRVGLSSQGFIERGNFHFTLLKRFEGTCEGRFNCPPKYLLHLTLAAYADKCK